MIEVETHEKKIKICHLVSGDLWAGAEVMAYNLISSLHRNQRVTLMVIVLNQGLLAEKLIQKNIYTIVIDEKNNSFFEILRKVNTNIKIFSPDIIHSHRYKENLIAYLISIRYKNIKILSTLHGFPELLGKKKNLKHRFVNKLDHIILTAEMTKVIVVSNEMKRWFLKNYPKISPRISAIHNGISITESASPVRSFNHFIIGTAGRLFPIKDYPTMVKIAAIIANKIPQIKFQIAGEGPEKNEILKQITRHGLEKKFNLIGFRSNIQSFYKEIHIFINTSLHEGIPMSILEAQALGLPVVAFNVGGLSEIIENGINGFLVNERNFQLFAEYCVQLFSDQNLYQKMSVAAKEKIRTEFSNEKMSLAYYKLYCKVLRKN